MQQYFNSSITYCLVPFRTHIRTKNEENKNIIIHIKKRLDGCLCWFFGSFLPLQTAAATSRKKSQDKCIK